MSEKKNHSVPEVASGFIFQFLRALLHLCSCQKGDVVGIETLDDVHVTSQQKEFFEQDKYSLQENHNPITDKSENLWKTLNIWLETYVGYKGEKNIEFYFVTNQSVHEKSLISKISNAKEEVELNDCYNLLLLKNESKTNSIQKIMTKVCSYDESVIKAVIKRITLDDSNSRNIKQDVIDSLGLPAGIDELSVYDSIVGWVVNSAMAHWQIKKPCLIDAQAFFNAKFQIISEAKSIRFLEKAELDIILTEDAKENVKCNEFVNQLTMIDFEHEDVLGAIEEFLRFNIEYWRLVNEGEVTRSEFHITFHEMTKRWEKIKDRVIRSNVSSNDEQVGQIILDQTAYNDWLITLGRQKTRYMYFTAGGYHRLADEKKVWWHPNNKVENEN